jgi:S1-C subfamily serine protease
MSYDYETDLNLAIISVPLADIPEAYRNDIKAATMGESYGLSIGSPIIALGSPNGHTNSMEIGVITSKGSTVGITDNRLELFNTDINDYDSSDGIIVNLKGDVIGVITRTLKEGVNEQLNTVIGISRVKSIIEKMANKEPRIYFGVKTEDLTDTAKQEHHVENGIYVDEVLANSPAFEAGIKNGDIILQIDDENVINSYDFYNNISTNKPDDTIKVKVKRTTSSSEKDMDLEITLEAKK